MSTCSRKKHALMAVLGFTVLGDSRHYSIAIEPDADQAPVLQRAILLANKAYYFSFDSQRGAGTPIFIETKSYRNESRLYFLFGTTQRIHTAKWPFRWNCGESILFCSNASIEMPPHPSAPSVLRFPFLGLVGGVDDGRWPFDDSRILPKFKIGGRLSTMYGGLSPIRDALHGFHRGWKEGVNHVGSPAKAVHYDIQAIDDDTIELFMTVDGDLSRWMFDGKKWKNLKHYDRRVEGEFLLCNDGRSLVTEVDGRWSIVRDFEDEKAAIEPIIDREDDEPLILVEDVVNRSSFFIHRDRLWDDGGRELKRFDSNRTNRERIREAIDYVFSHRQP